MARKKISIKRHIDDELAAISEAKAARRYIVREKSERRIHVALTESQYEQAAEVAKEWNVSFAALVKAALEAAHDEFRELKKAEGKE